MWSWIDFSQMMTKRAYDRKSRIDMRRFLADLSTVGFYMLMFMSVDKITTKGHIGIYLVWYPIIFLFYYLSGVLRIKSTNDPKASRDKLLLFSTVIFTALFITYLVLEPVISLSINGYDLFNFIVLLIFISSYIGYRYRRRWLRENDIKHEKMF